MKISNYPNYLWIEPESKDETLELKSVYEDGGKISLAVSIHGSIMALKVWKDKRS